jgi:hypothetical protein
MKSKEILQNKGRILFDSLDAAKFFLRAFNLEKDVEEALAMFKHVPKEHDRIGCPIVAEYRVDASLTFVFCFLITVDPIGLSSGTGYVFYADDENLSEVLEKRDKIAAELLRHMEGKPGGTVILDPHEEKGRL